MTAGMPVTRSRYESERAGESVRSRTTTITATRKSSSAATSAARAAMSRWRSRMATPIRRPLRADPTAHGDGPRLIDQRVGQALEKRSMGWRQCSTLHPRSSPSLTRPTRDDRGFPTGLRSPRTQVTSAAVSDDLPPAGLGAYACWMLACDGCSPSADTACGRRRPRPCP
jgi:hypothetical protein